MLPKKQQINMEVKSKIHFRKTSKRLVESLLGLLRKVPKKLAKMP